MHPSVRRRRQNAPDDPIRYGRRICRLHRIQRRLGPGGTVPARQRKNRSARPARLARRRARLECRGRRHEKRPAGGWTPDMYNYANSVDVYSIWADMVVYDKTYVDLNQRKYFAVYAGRRNGKNYIHTPEEIRERYRDQIVMDEDIPEIISGAMGDHMWTARLDTEEQKDEFIDFVQATWQ